MNNNKQYPSDLISQFICPQCGANQNQGFDFNNLHCRQCGLEHFQLGDIPCLFPSGVNHKLLWGYQVAAMTEMARQGLASMEESLSRYDLLPSTRQRIQEIHNSSKGNTEAIIDLMRSCGVVAPDDYQPGQFNAGDLAEYFDLVLRDWAWDTTEEPNTENSNAYQRVIDAIKKLPDTPKRILVLGAGAGRLSWDIHSHIKPEYSVVLDSNPLLLAVANRLIHQQRSLTFGEFKNFPQINFPTIDTWSIPPIKDPENLRATWFPLGANVWQLPFSENTFDLVITPWFIDVNGGDVRDLIGVINNKLVPGGHWINSGPLLFTRHLPVQLKYSASEIKEFISLANFTFDHEQISNANYLLSPLEARFRQEQIWTFSAQKNNAITEAYDRHFFPPAWLALHHLPVPKGHYPNSNNHPLIEAIVLLVNGEHSINDICFHIAPHLPENVSVKDVVVTVFGQILKGQQQ